VVIELLSFFADIAASSQPEPMHHGLLKKMVGRAPGLMLCKGEISAYRLPNCLYPKPPGPLSRTGLNKTSAFGLEETEWSSYFSSRPVIFPAAAAK